jgi:hypothetical protein
MSVEASNRIPSDKLSATILPIRPNRSEGEHVGEMMLHRSSDDFDRGQF